MAALPEFQAPNPQGTLGGFQFLNNAIGNLGNVAKQNRLLENRSYFGGLVKDGDTDAAIEAANKVGDYDAVDRLRAQKQQQDTQANQEKQLSISQGQLGVSQAQLAIAQQKEKEDLYNRHVARAAGVAQYIQNAPEEQKAALWQKLYGADPILSKTFQSYGIGPNDHQLGTSLLLREAQGFQTPQFTQVGEDRYGQKQFGFVNLNAANTNQAVTVLPSGTSAAMANPGGAVHANAAPSQPTTPPVPQSTASGLSGLTASVPGAQPDASYAAPLVNNPVANARAPLAASAPVSPPQGPQTNGAIDEDVTNLSGPELLAKLPKDDQSVVMAMVQGRSPMYSGRAATSGYGAYINGMAQRVDPTLDANTYKVRGKVASDFATGRQGDAVGAFQTYLQHLQHISDASEKLNNYSVPGANWIANKYENNVGDPRVSNFNMIRNKVVEEGRKLYSGSGGSEAELERDLAELNPNSSPRQLRAVIGSAVDLGHAKLKTLQKQYEEGMGPFNYRKKTFIEPETQAAMEKIRQRAAGPEQPQQTSSGNPYVNTAVNQQNGHRIGQLATGQWVDIETGQPLQ